MDNFKAKPSPLLGIAEEFRGGVVFGDGSSRVPGFQAMARHRGGVRAGLLEWVSPLGRWGVFHWPGFYQAVPLP
ncbi:hypothetical protein MishRS11D_32090 [Methylomagnum ishizawai]|nr:hypothetical protein MishRS11D_32090 [Methylomagnum ishizawai]